MQVPADTAARAGRAYRAWAVIVLCGTFPVLVGFLLTGGATAPAPPPVPAPAGHWLYVPGKGTAVHVDGAARRVDATVRVGSASTGSPVLADERLAYLVDSDRVVVFDRDTGVSGAAPAVRAGEDPVALAASGTAYLVYRHAGLVVRLGPQPRTVPVGGPLGAAIITPAGHLWIRRVDTGDLCVLAEKPEVDCPIGTEADHDGALAMKDGTPIFVDTTASTWQPFGERAEGEPVPLAEPLPPDAVMGTATVAGRLPVTDVANRRLVLVAPEGEDVVIPLGPGRFSRPVSTAGAVAVLNRDTGELTTWDATGRRRATATVTGDARLAHGDDGRVYADSIDGLRTVIMDADGGLTPVRTTAEEPPSYRAPPPAPVDALPPATVAPTTTETVPPVPETVTVVVTPQAPAPPGTTTAPPPATARPSTTSPVPPPPPPAPAGKPTVDVLSASATGPDRATIRVRVVGAGPVFCHLYVNSVERAATRCAGTMDIVATNLPTGAVHDIYVLGTNLSGTGDPGRRAQLRL